MNIKNLVRYLFGNGESVKSISSDGFYTMVSLSEASSDKLHKLSATEYLGLYRSWVFACVSAIGNGLSSIEYTLTKNDKTIDHPYMKLIDENLLYGVVAYLKLSGTVYIYKKKIGRSIVGLELLRSDYVKEKGDIIEYHNKKQITKYKIEDIIKIKNFSPYAPGEDGPGFSDVQASAITLDSEHASEIRNWKFFERGTGKNDIMTTDEYISPEDAERFNVSWKTKYAGVNNSHKMIMLPKGVKPWLATPHQKEADFVEHQRLSRDKILAIFNVPKALIGMGENVNVGNVDAFYLVFARTVLVPLARKVARALNTHIFKDIGEFEFINIVPVNEEDIRADYINGIITRNEARQAKGRPTISNGDTFHDGNVAEKQKAPPKAISTKTIDIEKAVRKSLPGTPEYLEDRHSKYVDRLNKYDKEILSKLKDIFHQQEEDILSQLPKSIKGIKNNIPQLNLSKYLIIYISSLTDILRGIFTIEASSALKEIKPSNDDYIMSTMDKLSIKKAIGKLADTVDTNTNKYIMEFINSGLSSGLSPAEIRNGLMDIFKNLELVRASTIVRTETVRLATQSQITARSSIGIQKKQWYTAVDERVCPFCKEMHDRVTEINSNYYPQGSDLSVINDNGDIQTIKFDYSDINGPPLHPSCRCSLLAIVE